MMIMLFYDYYNIWFYIIFMWWVKTLCSHQVSQPDPLSLLSQVAGVKAIGFDRGMNERCGDIMDHNWIGII